MFSSDKQRGGFATIAIIGGTVVAVAVGGVFYFLRSQPPVVDTTLTEGSVAVFGDGSDLSIDAERVLLRGLPRGRGTNYCSLLGLDRETCADGAGRACQDLFGSCRIDVRDDVSDNQRQLAEACLVLGSPKGRSLYFAWLDSNDPNPFPLHYAIFGLSSDTFSQKDLSDAYQTLFASYRSASSCDNSDVSRLLTEGLLMLSDSDGRAMYNAWLRDGSSDPFPLYCASLGVRRDTFTQERVEVAYRKILDRYFSGYYGDNPEILRLITESYMVLRTQSSSSACKESFDGGLGTDFSDTSFTFDGGELVSALTDLDLSLGEVGSTLGSFSFSPVNLAGLLTTNLSLSPGDLGTLLPSLGLSSGDLGALLGNLNLPLLDLGILLGNLNLSPIDLGTLLGNFNLSTGDFGLSAADLGTLLSTLNLSPADLGTLLGTLNLSAGDFGLSAADLGTLLGTLNLSPADLGTLLGNLNLSPADLGTLLSTLNLSPADLGTLLGDLNLSPADLGILLGNLNLSPVDLGTLLGDFNIPPIDFDITSRPTDPFTVVTTPPNDTSGLPTITISAYPRYGQIGVSSDAQISFQLAVTKDGSAYTPDTPIPIVLTCSQSVDAGQSTTSLISGALPLSAVIAADTSTTIVTLADRNPDVTGSVKCAVTLDTSAVDAVYTVGFPSSAIVTVVSGSSHSLCGRAPCDSSLEDIPSLSITAFESPINTGEVAVFRVSANRDLFLPLQVKYSCSIRPDDVADSSAGGEKVTTISGGSGGFTADIRIQTKPGISGLVDCSLRDDITKYTLRNRRASVAVGSLRVGDTALYDPALPTVSLLAYQSDEDNPISFSEAVTDAVVESPNTYFGFVVDDPDSDFSDPFATLVSTEVVSEGNSRLLHAFAPGYNIFVGHDLTLLAVDSNASTEQILPVGWNNSVDFGKDRVVIEREAERVLMRKGTGETVVCGEDQGVVACSTYRAAVADLEPLRVVVQCFRDFSDRGGEREVFDGLVGGLYHRSAILRYGVEVSDYVAGADDPKGTLYQFILPKGVYNSADEELPLGTLPFIEVDSTFSCEIVGGGVEDGYNVGTWQAGVQVHPRPTVSIEGSGVSRFGNDSDLPNALLERGEPGYDFENSDFSFLDEQSGGEGGIPDVDASLGDVLSGLGKSFAVGFLTSFGGCVGGTLLGSGITALGNKLGLKGFGKVSVEDATLQLKECTLDSAVFDAAMQVITGVARDYITWASEGFDGKPLFVKNPTTFYKNFHDDAIGRVIDRSGLGFLCDIGVGSPGTYTANIHIKLQQRYHGLATERPRCTYNDLSNNLEEYYDDATSALNALNDSTYKDVEKLLGITIKGTASTEFGGTRYLRPPASAANNQLDALSANLDRTMKEIVNSKNILLAISDVDDAVSETVQEVVAVAKPGVQLFDPNDPTSVPAFQECTEEQNPEGDADCITLNASASRVAGMVGDGINAVNDRFLQIDEFGEIGQLVTMAVEATSSGLMRRYLKDGFGWSAQRDTANILSSIETGFKKQQGIPYSVGEVGIDERWWSVFFDDNLFYKDILTAEIYARDVSTLLQYLGSSLYVDPRRVEYNDTHIPPVSPYTAFYTTFGSGGEGVRYPFASYDYFKDISVATLSYHYNRVYDSNDITEVMRGDDDGKRSPKEHLNTHEGGWWGSIAGGTAAGAAIGSFFGGVGAIPGAVVGAVVGVAAGALNNYIYSNRSEGWVKKNLFSVFNNWVKSKESEEELGHRKFTALKRFDDAYHFLVNDTVRRDYDAFVADIGPFIEDSPYAKLHNTQWIKKSIVPTSVGDVIRSVVPIPPSFLGLRELLVDMFPGNASVRILYPEHYTRLVKDVVGVVSKEACLGNEAACADACSEPLRQGPKADAVATCTVVEVKIDSRTQGVEKTYTCQDESATFFNGCKFIVKVGGGPNSPPPYTFQKCETHTAQGGPDGTTSVMVEENGFSPFSSEMESYCPGTISAVVVGTHANFETIKKLRKIYEATLAVYVRFVGTVDEYVGAPLVDSAISSYRKNIWDRGNYVSGSDKWRAVQKATLESFRDGTMDVYIPLDDDEFTASDYEGILGRCRKSSSKVVFRVGAYLTEYQKMGCVLGTVFQDQAWFEVRRDNADLSEPLTVHLVCGYDGDGAVDEDNMHLSFKKVNGNPKPYSVVLGKGQDSVRFPVDKPLYNPFVVGDVSRAGTRMRCSINFQQSGVEGGEPTASVTVSEHSMPYPNTFHNTFHARVHALRSGGGVPARTDTRVDQIASALFHTYVLGWYTGFVDMPYYSIQGLLSNPPVSLVGNSLEVMQATFKNQAALRRYRLLSSLYADESSSKFSTEHYGFLTPQEAYDLYKHSYDARFNAYFGRALGGFLNLVPASKYR